MPLTPSAVTMETQSAFMAAAAATVLLVTVLLRRRDATALWFGGLVFAFGLYSLGRGSTDLAPAWSPFLTSLGLAGLGALAPMAASSLAGRQRLIRRLRPLALLGPLLWVGVMLALGPEHGPLRAALNGWALLGVAGSASLLLRFGPDPDKRHTPEATRLRYLAIAHAIVALAAIGDVAMWKFGLPRVASLMVPLFYLYAGYLHLAQVRVADLRQLMGTTVALTFMALGLAGAFAAIRIWVGTGLGPFVLNSFVVSFVLLLTYPAIREKVHHLMDRYFVAGKLELQRALGSLAERLQQVRTLDELLKDLLGSLEQVDRLRSSSIFLRDAPDLGFQQAGSIGLPPRTRLNLIRDPIWIEALEQEEAVLVEELEKARGDARSEPDQHRLETLCRIMHDLDAQLVLPLFADNELVGFWTLSDMAPREPFSTTEVRVLRSIADQIALSIENSKTFERIRVRDRLANLGEMAAGLAHEIRNPLATIRGAVAVMTDPGDETSSEFKDVIVEEINRLDRVVSTFLDYAKPSTRRSLLPDLEGFVHGCVTAVARQHKDRKIKLSIRVQGQIPPITANADQLERVIANVVQNAYEAIDDEGSIQVQLKATPPDSEPGAAVAITVTDTGRGMDETTLGRAFIPFFTTKDTGTGLGLALCEKLVRSEGGTIELQSEPGTGTRVRILLPHEPETPIDAGETHAA